MDTLQKNLPRFVFLAIAISIGLFAAYKSAGPTVVWVAVAIVATISAMIAAWPLLPKELQRSSGAGVPAELNPLLVEHLDSAKERIIRANAALDAAKLDLTSKRAALVAVAAAVPPDQAAIQAARENVIRAEQAVSRAQRVVGFEEAQRDSLLNPGLLSKLSAQWNWTSFSQYAIFGSLAAYVLFKLMEGITSSPPPGTTPRGMITLLISVVTVGIALILVLSTIVSANLDEKRFSQGKEVLTALLGVLGTIVGFYFGTTQEQAGTFTFDPIVVQAGADGQITLSTRVQGGRPDYLVELNFTPATIAGNPPSATTKNGVITTVIDASKLQAETDVSLVIRVTDSSGRTGYAEFKPVVKLKAGGKL